MLSFTNQGTVFVLDSQMVHMKYLSLVMALLLFLSPAIAQYETDETEFLNYKPFRVDLMAGGAVIPSNIISGGVLFQVEPRYAFHPRLNSGLRFQGAGLVRSFYTATIDQQKVQADISLMGSSLLTTDYYFSSSDLRPFAGAGGGVYWYSNASFKGDAGANTDPLETRSGAKGGFMIRAGLEAFHMRVAAEYNFVGKTGRTRNSYLGVTAGFYLGGGREL